MSTYQSRLDAAAGEATCILLGGMGLALAQYGAVSIVAGGTGLIPFGVGAAGVLASRYLCNWDSEGPSTLPPGESLITPGSCLEANGCGLLLRDVNGLQMGSGPCQKLLSVEEVEPYPNGTGKVIFSWLDCDGVVQSDDEAITRFPMQTKLKEGFSCGGDVAPEPPPQVPDYVYTDEGDTECSINVKFLGMALEPDGTGAPVWQMEPANTGTRAGGGIIGGCNFSPVIYYQPNPPAGDGSGNGGGDGGKPPTVFPVPDDDIDGGGPDWPKLLKQALATAAGNLVASAIKELLEQPYEGVDYLMPAPCDIDENGIPLIWMGQIPVQKFEPAVLDRLDAISSQITQHLQWKTPICGNESVPLQGDWRTISFRSDEVSPYGSSRLRKRLRYRSVSGNDLAALVDHWRNFTWQAGPVVVGHVGGPWGSPQVWAASESEGKLVLHHAAAEAGFDPDQVGQWKVGVSSGTRLGVSGTMRVDTTGGYYWITARDGSDNRPIVATSSDL